MRNNLFLIEFDVPDMILTNIPKQTLQLQVRGSDAPGFEINTKDDNFLNRKTSMANGLKQVLEWEVKFREKYGANSIANIFEQWRMLLINYSYEQGTIDTYKTQMLVKQLFLDGTSTNQQWRLINAYPYKVSDIPLEYKEDPDLVEVTVTFKYDYRTIVGME